MDERPSSTGKNCWKSYDQFFKMAYNIISKSLDRDKESGLNENILYSLTDVQINQYNLVELQTFQLSKEIKSKLSRFDQKQVSALLIKAKNILEQLQRMCTSLNIKFIFKLFQKLMMCLTIMTTLHFKSKQPQQPPQTPISHPQKSTPATSFTTPFTTPASTSTKQNKQNSPPPKKTAPQQQSTKSVGEELKKLKQVKMGGISLYNENYKRHVQNQQLTVNLKEALGEYCDRKGFWKELESSYKETVGTLVEDKVCENNKSKQTIQPSQNNQKYQKIPQSQPHSSPTPIAMSQAQPQNSLQIDQSFCLNAYNTLHFSEIFSQELQSYDFSEQCFKKVIDDVSSLYKKQKILTLDSLNKIVAKFLEFVDNRADKMKELLGLEVQKRMLVQDKLKSKYEQMKSVGVETLPCVVTEKLKSQVEKFKIMLNISEKTVKGLEQKLHKQSVDLVGLEKLNVQNRKKMEGKDKILREYQQKILKMQSTLELPRQIKPNGQTPPNQSSKRLSLTLQKNPKKTQQIPPQAYLIQNKNISQLQSEINLNMQISEHSSSHPKVRNTLRHINFCIPEKDQSKKNFQNQQFQEQNQFQGQVCEKNGRSFTNIRKLRKKLRICPRTVSFKMICQFNSRGSRDKYRCTECSNNLRKTKISSSSSFKAFQSYKDIRFTKNSLYKAEVKSRYRSIFDDNVQKNQGNNEHLVYKQLKSKSEKKLKVEDRQNFQDIQQFFKQKQNCTYQQIKQIRNNDGHHKMVIGPNSSHKINKKLQTIYCFNSSSNDVKMKNKNFPLKCNKYAECSIKELKLIESEERSDTSNVRGQNEDANQKTNLSRIKGEKKRSYASIQDSNQIGGESKAQATNKNLVKQCTSRISVARCNKTIFVEQLNKRKIKKCKQSGQKFKKTALRKTTPVWNDRIFEQSSNQQSKMILFTQKQISQQLENGVQFEEKAAAKISKLQFVGGNEAALDCEQQIFKL